MTNVPATTLLLLRRKLPSNKAQTRKSSNRVDIVYEILSLKNKITNDNEDITILWVSSHFGIKGNDEVDKLSRLEVKQVPIENTFFFAIAQAVRIHIKSGIKISWQ